MSYQSVREFVAERVEIDPLSWHSTEALHDAYLDFCGEESLPGYTKVGFGRGIREVVDANLSSSLRAVDGDRVRGIVGLRVEGVPRLVFDHDAGEWVEPDVQEESDDAE